MICNDKKTSYEAILIQKSYSSEKYSISLNGSNQWEMKMIFLQHMEKQALIGKRVIIATKEKNSIVKTNYNTCLQGK